VHPCDKRRHTSYYAQRFPAVDFSLVESETDALWQPAVRETREELQARALKFLHLVMARPERHIAVVSHSGFLKALLRPFAAGGWGRGAAGRSHAGPLDRGKRAGPPCPVRAAAARHQAPVWRAAPTACLGCSRAWQGQRPLLAGCLAIHPCIGLLDATWCQYDAILKPQHVAATDSSSAAPATWCAAPTKCAQPHPTPHSHPTPRRAGHSEAGQAVLLRPFNNCELRSVVASLSGGDMHPDPIAFAGGAALKLPPAAQPPNQ
jgi:hypothetical protein